MQLKHFFVVTQARSLTKSSMSKNIIFGFDVSFGLNVIRGGSLLMAVKLKSEVEFTRNHWNIITGENVITTTVNVAAALIRDMDGILAHILAALFEQ